MTTKGVVEKFVYKNVPREHCLGVPEKSVKNMLDFPNGLNLNFTMEKKPKPKEFKHSEECSQCYLELH